MSDNLAPFGPEYITLDSPDGLTGVFTAYANSVFEWCDTVQIDAEFIARWVDESGSHSRWRIDNPDHRTLFILQWGSKNG